MKKLLPIIIALVGIGGGVGAGIVLRPAPEPAPIDVADAGSEESEEKSERDSGYDDEEGPSTEFVKLNNQFVIPIVNDERVTALVVMSLSVEVPAGQLQTTYSREPKLRDAFLQVMFDHANRGGFDGAFTNANTMDILRRSLREASYHAVGDLVQDVLITEMVRQDI